MGKLGAGYSIVMRAIDRICPRVTKSTGIDKKRWATVLMRYMPIFEPDVHRAVVGLAVQQTYASLIEAYIRSSKSAAVENLTDLEKIKRTLKEGNRLVQVKSDDGQYRAKRLRDCTPIELDGLALQYERSAQSDMRRAKFCRLLARQMRLAGLADDAPLSELLAV